MNTKDIEKKTQKIFKVKGLDGHKLLKGSIKVNGAKNSALKAIASSLLFNGPVSLCNIPFTRDTEILLDILKKLGAEIKIDKKNDEIGVNLSIDTSKINRYDPDPDLSEKMRASVVLTGPLLSRFGKVSFPSPGGCTIGERPIDLFIKGYKKMSTEVIIKDGLYIMSSKNEDLKIDGAEIFFDIQTVGGTETLMMAGILAKGTTILKNCAMEPEIVSLAEFLIENGADISGVGTTTITIKGRNGKLLEPKTSYITIPDRIEAGSFMILGAMLGQDLKIERVNINHLESLFSIFDSLDIRPVIMKNKDQSDLSDIIFNKENSNRELKKAPVLNVRTHEYPGFPTDLQSPITAFLASVGIESHVFETIYEGRFRFVNNLIEMGACIKIDNPREITINPSHSTKKSESDSGEIKYNSVDDILDAYDIRAGFATLLAGIYAKGETKIKNIHFIDRGYEDIDNRLKRIGVDIQRVDMI